LFNLKLEDIFAFHNIYGAITFVNFHVSVAMAETAHCGPYIFSIN